MRHRRKSASPADLHLHVFHDRRRLLGGEFIGYAEARRLARIAEPVLQLPLVHFDHDAIKRVREAMAFFVPLLIVSLDGFHRPAQTIFGIDLEAQFFQKI